MYFGKNRIIIKFIIVLLIISILVQGVLLLLEPFSIEYTNTNKMTFGYFIYDLIGLLFSTPSPVIATFIILRKAEKISLKEFIRRFFKNAFRLKTIIITLSFCFLAFVFALINGIRIDGSWLLMIGGLIIMIPFVGFAEETGWRGILQPELEKKYGFLTSTLIVAIIWYVWHLPIWLMPSSNHYGDSLIGFGITILVWSFVSASIYKTTKSVFACAFYHAFIDSLGAVYDWNKLFDSFPKD
ncbi:MAG: CPBP family intramembrane metalloprotease, partial [Crenarchaeota archaeon]|nr:CPBP family intramembrane metalloprotease [Thermoproteota archaeon]